jgi:hypothetical protein
LLRAQYIFVGWNVVPEDVFFELNTINDGLVVFVDLSLMRFGVEDVEDAEGKLIRIRHLSEFSRLLTTPCGRYWKRKYSTFRNGSKGVIRNVD